MVLDLLVTLYAVVVPNIMRERVRSPNLLNIKNYQVLNKRL